MKVIESGDLISPEDLWERLYQMTEGEDCEGEKRQQE
jgi:hypothetical protein